MEPRRPTKSLKNGKIIANTVVSITNDVLQIKRNKLMLILSLIIEYSFVMKSLLGHFVLLQLSMNAYIGWENTCLEKYAYKNLDIYKKMKISHWPLV